MRAPAPLPEPFASRPFRASEAQAAGVSRSRTRRGDLVAPFRDVRASSIDSVVDLAAAYAVRMREGHVFGGVTAARLWGLPLPTDWSRDEPLVIARPNGETRSAVTGTRHVAFDARRMGVGTHRGLPILGPLGTALLLARELQHEPLVHILDALLTPSWRYPGLDLPQRPHSTPAALDDFVRACAGLAGIGALRAAAADAPRRRLPLRDDHPARHRPRRSARAGRARPRGGRRHRRPP